MEFGNFYRTTFIDIAKFDGLVYFTDNIHILYSSTICGTINFGNGIILFVNNVISDSLVSINTVLQLAQCLVLTTNTTSASQSILNNNQVYINDNRHEHTKLNDCE